MKTIILSLTFNAANSLPLSFKELVVIVLLFFLFTGSRVVVSKLPDAESAGDGHDHAALKESTTDTLSFSSSQT